MPKFTKHNIQKNYFLLLAQTVWAGVVEATTLRKLSK